jgi:transposase|tara:strand:- start:719 stop:1153 length:435 start_codon:yes stop_codon:yes gene_type:complete
VSKKYVVDLTEEERKELERLIRSGKDSARRIRYAQALLKADAGWTDQRISEAFEMSTNTAQRLRQRFVEEGMDVALGARSRKPKPCRRKLDGEKEAHLIALACSRPPEGHTRWTLRMLADKMVQLCYVDTVSHETVRRVLKKTN